MNENIQEFVDQKKIIIVGASRQGNKFGNSAARELEQRGYEVFFVHPEAKEIEGHPTYPDLGTASHLAQSLWVSVPAEQGAQVLREAAKAGLKRVWLQQGAGSQELLTLGNDLDLQLISGKCILMYAEPVGSFHKFHQVIWKWIGKY